MIEKIEAAAAAQQLSETAVQNLRIWLSEPRYAAYVPEIVKHVEAGQFDVLDDVFWTVIPFGTGGRRGRMYPIGSNAVNERTIGESAKGLADYVRSQAALSDPLACAIAFDTRHNSPEFARLCAEIMVAEGFRVYLLPEIRSTPELSFLVRFKQCACGIMITASHNPPSDNAVKCYWSTGGQLLPPHDRGVIDCVMQVDEIRRANFDQAVADGNIENCMAETDAAFLAALSQQRFEGPRDAKIIYSPLHGVGSTAVLPILKADGFSDVEVFGPHATPDGDFPNVPGNVSNPENRAVFEAIIAEAQQVGADLILATDPDCDRLGCASPCTADVTQDWEILNGNQIAALLTDFVLRKRREQGSLSPEHYVVKTLVTTEMVRHIADAYGARTVGDLLVGFKWIGGVMDELGPDQFVFGAEESHGYLVGQYARDKDGAVAAMLMSELAAECKAVGETVVTRLDALYRQHGYFAERLLTQKMPGSEGMALMKKLMATFRATPPHQLAGIDVAAIRDYQSNVRRSLDGSESSLEGPTGDLVMLDLAEPGNFIAVRPSGTEPKVKFYVFTQLAPNRFSDLAAAKTTLADRIDGIAKDLTEFAAAVSA